MNQSSPVRIPTIEQKTNDHPCFHCGASNKARIHLPIAPACNIQCNYCVRKFDCMNESRPGVVSKVLSPEEALERFKEVKRTVPNLTVVGIAGPGDALANFDELKETLTRIRAIDPQITFCLSTNGLLLPLYANHLISLGVTHVTVTVNAITPETGAKVYDTVRYLGRTYSGVEGASILLRNQLAGISHLASMGIVVKVNIVMLPGINDEEIHQIVAKVKNCGCKITNILPLIPVKESKFGHLKPADKEEMLQLKKDCEQILPQMYHCKQCRADAIGTLEKDLIADFQKSEEKACKEMKVEEAMSEKIKLRFAVCTTDGSYVDQHFGQAEQFYIYAYEDGNVEFVEIRVMKEYMDKATDSEAEEEMPSLITIFKDCSGVLCTRMGMHKEVYFKEYKIPVFIKYDSVVEGIKEAANQVEMA